MIRNTQYVGLLRRRRTPTCQKTKFEYTTARGCYTTYRSHTGTKSTAALNGVAYSLPSYLRPLHTQATQHLHARTYHAQYFQCSPCLLPSNHPNLWMYAAAPIPSFSTTHDKPVATHIFSTNPDADLSQGMPKNFRFLAQHLTRNKCAHRNGMYS